MVHFMPMGSTHSAKRIRLRLVVGLGCWFGVFLITQNIMIKEKTPQNFDQLEKPSVNFTKKNSEQILSGNQT